MVAEGDFDARFWRIFSRVLGRKVEPGHYSVDELPEWDSLRHVEMIFELEEAFSLDIEPADIVKLYSDTATVLGFLEKEAASTE